MNSSANANDSLPTPPSSPQSHSAPKTSNVNANASLSSYQDHDEDNNNNESNDHENNDNDNNNNNNSNNLTMRSMQSQPLFPLQKYTSASTQSNLLHALPDLSAHHHHPLHSLNTIITNAHPLYPMTPLVPMTPLTPMTPVHHTHSHDHHHHHHIAAPFMTSLYSPRFPHTHTSVNPFMPSINDTMPSIQDKESEKEKKKTLTGLWIVYYTWDTRRDTDMSKPRYQMELKQHKGGNVEGKCIEGSGPAAWTFLLTGKIEKNKTFKYTMHGEDEEIYGRATFDGNDTIKNGMWYRDKLYLRKGGSLVAVRKEKGGSLKRKHQHQHQLPSKRQKTNHVHRANRRHKVKNKKKVKERIKKVKQKRKSDVNHDQNMNILYNECDLSGAWSLYFDNSVSSAVPADASMENESSNDSNDDCDEAINNDTLFLCHNTDTHELSGFVCSPLKCYVTGSVSPNGIDVRLIMIWSPNKDLGGQFAGYVTVINGEYDTHRGLNCEYCSFHCTSYFHTVLYRLFEKEIVNITTKEEKMRQFQCKIKAAVDETKYNNSHYVSIVEDWFYENENDVSPGQIHSNSNKNNYSNQCIWRRRKLPLMTYNHIDRRISLRKKQKQKRKHMMDADDAICKNQSPFFFGDLVQLFVAFNTVLSHPLSYYDLDLEDADSDLEDDDVAYFGAGKWVDGVITNIYETKVLVGYFYESAMYQQWIDCGLMHKERVTIQPLIRLRKSLKFSCHLQHIVSQLNNNALSAWRLDLNKLSVVFACDENGEWAKAVIKRRFGCFVYIHWVHFDAKYDQYLSIHSQRIQPLHASDICNSFRPQLKFQNVLRIKPNKTLSNNTEEKQKEKEKQKEYSNDDFEIIEQNTKSTASSNIFGSLILHLRPTK